MKVVINGCFGGFSISIEALYELVKMKSSAVRKTTLKKWFGDDWAEDIKKLVDYKDGFKRAEYIPVLFKGKYAYSLKDGDEVRKHPDLIKVVNELGDNANGSCAKLMIVEIPDGVDYEIEEYDGNEHIAEKHRTWR